jgi:sugar phosphate isomerase/epimerase
MDAAGFIVESSKLGFRRILLCENLKYSHHDDTYFKKIKELLDESGIAAETGMRGISLEKIKRHIEIAKLLNSPFLRTVIGGGENDNDKPLLKDNVSRSIEEILPCLEKNEMVIGIENHFDLSTDDICEIADKFESRHIALIYDSTNGTGLLEPPLFTLEKMGPRIISAHIKNYIVKKIEGGYFFAGTDLDKGKLDTREVISKVLEYNPESSIILEYNIKPEGAMGESELLLWERERIVANHNYLKSI